MGFEKKLLVWSVDSIIWLVKAAFYVYQQFLEHQAAGWWILLPRSRQDDWLGLGRSICSWLTGVHSAMYPSADATTADLYHTEYEKVKRPSAAGIERTHQWFTTVMNYSQPDVYKYRVWQQILQQRKIVRPLRFKHSNEKRVRTFSWGSKALYLGGAQSCRVQSSRVPTYVLFLQVTLTTSIPVWGGIKCQFLQRLRVKHQ